MFEEVKEMIDSTIYTNGRGEVTAQNINLAMNGMVDVVGEKFAEVDDAVKAVEDKVTKLEQNGPASANGPLRVWAPSLAELTEEQKVENADTLAELVNGYAGLVYIISQAKMQEENAYGFYTIATIADGLEAGVMEEAKMAFLSSTSGIYYLYEDGTVELIES